MSKEYAHEIAAQFKHEFYHIDAELNRLKRAVEMAPDKYLAQMQINPQAYYLYELAKARYEIGLELKALLKSEPKPQPVTEKEVMENATDLNRLKAFIKQIRKQQEGNQ